MIPHNALNSVPDYWILFPIASYLGGSIPFGRLISKRVANIDITQRGSGNIGAANVAREVGIQWGIFTLFLDALKGFGPVALFRAFFPHFELGLSIVGLSTLLGHQFSLYQRFRGGKGVSTALGLFLAVSPLSCLVGSLFFLLTVYAVDFISLGSMVSASSVPLTLFLSGKSDTLMITSLIVVALICWKHGDNLRRLFNGNETRWRRKAVT